MDKFGCDCTEEFGPCEQHSETLVVREGASLRTADELQVIFIEDAVSLGAELSPYGKDVLSRANAALSANESPWETHWLPDTEDGAELNDELGTVANQMETELYTLGLSVYWEDGYRIVRITGGPLADTEDGE